MVPLRGVFLLCGVLVYLTGCSQPSEPSPTTVDKKGKPAPIKLAPKDRKPSPPPP